jgi:hypothetical protein
MASVLLLAVLKRWGPDMTASACKFFFTFTKFMASILLSAVLKRWGPNMTASACKFFFTFTKFMASALLLAVPQVLGSVRHKIFILYVKFMASVLLLAVLKRWGPDMTASACEFFFYFYQIHVLSSPFGRPKAMRSGYDGLCM